MDSQNANSAPAAPEAAPASSAPADISMTEQSAQKAKAAASRAMSSAMSKIPNELKIIFLGGLLAFIGSFLPWWSMKQSSGEAYTITAFNDSTFLLGVLVFLGAVLSIVVGVFEFMKKKPGFIKMPHSLLQLVIGGEMTLLMFIAVSILTSPRFSSVGVVSRVEVGVSFGLFVTLLGAVMIAVGGFLEWKGAGILEGLGKKSAMTPKKTESEAGAGKSDMSTESAGGAGF